MSPDSLDAVVAVLRPSAEGLSATEVAAVVGASRVTARRYLEHLADSGLVVRRSRYGGAGRPEVEYRWVDRAECARTSAEFEQSRHGRHAGSRCPDSSEVTTRTWTPQAMHRPDASERLGSNADADDSAAHIAELVRRTTERQAAPGPSSVVGPDDTVAQQPPMPAPSVAQTPSQPVAQPLGAASPQPRMAHRAPQAPPAIDPVPMRTPSRRVLVAAGAVVAVLIAGGVALSHPFGS